MEKIKIQIIGDSMALHRRDEGILYTDTYPHILSKSYEVTRTCGYSKTTNHEYRVEPNMKYVIVQLGLVDCFPRVYAKKTKLILFYLPNKLRHMVTFFHRRFRFYFTRMFPRVTTEKDDFQDNMISMITEIRKSGAVPIIIDIVHVSNDVANRNYGANENIEKYNDILRKLSFQYDCERVRLNYMTKYYPEMLHTDGQHLSKVGHKVLAYLIDKTIEAAQW
jgi:lysophospholipase L1-like esterase